MDGLDKRLYDARLKTAQENEHLEIVANKQIKHIHKRLAAAVNEQERHYKEVHDEVRELRNQLHNHMYELCKSKNQLEMTTREKREIAEELECFCDSCIKFVGTIDANKEPGELPRQFKKHIDQLPELLKRFQQITQKNQEAIRKLDIARENCVRCVTAVKKKIAVDRPTGKCPGMKLDVLVHLEDLGDRRGHNNEFLGTRGQSRRLEGFSIKIDPPIPNLGIRYMAHLEDIGDVPYQQNGEFIGTRGQSRRLEGFAIELTGPAARKYDVLYMAHLQDRGDTPWCKNGQFCGTRGQSRRVEGISVRIVPRKKAQPGNNNKDAISHYSFDKKGLILHYSFDKNEGDKVTDLSGRGNHGEVHGAKWSPEGHAGGAYTFDGQSHINVANPRFLDEHSNATICAWFKCDLPPGQGGQIIASGDTRGGNDPISTRINTSAFEDFGFRDMLREQDIKSPWGGAQAIQPGSWQMLAITLESVPKGSIYKVYLDGKVVDHKKHPGRFAISYDRDMPTQIGAIHGIQGWIGMIDEVKVFNRTLSENEIRQMYHNHQ